MEGYKLVFWETVKTAVTVVVPILTACVGWIGNTVVNHESRLSRIEGSRYTITHAREDRNTIEDKLVKVTDNQDRKFEQITKLLHEIDKKVTENSVKRN
jgi:hypothetical protein